MFMGLDSSAEYAVKSQQVIFDTNNGWFSSSYDGSFDVVISSIGMGDSVVREWDDSDFTIY